MSSFADSTAQFEQRLSDCKVPATLRTALETAGITTISTLAYSFGQPGQTIDSIDDVKFATWVKTIDPNVTVGAVATLKRLLFESQTQLLALLKEQVTQPDNFVAKKLPQAEREMRLNNLKTRLAGQVIEGATEPGHGLLDQAVQMHEKNQVSYIPPEKCVSRLHELTSTKQPDKILEVESSKLIVKERGGDLEIAAQSALQVQEALRRRGLALDFADICSFAIHEKYIQTLFTHLRREPPAGFARCNVSQLVNADKEVWKKLIQDNVKPRRAIDGTKPIDSKLDEALKSYEVSFILMPLPSRSTPKTETKPSPSFPKAKPHAGPRPLVKPSINKPKGKGKGKTKWEPRIPQQIRDQGGKASLPSGEPICFSYNIGSCDGAMDGAKCTRGHHVCAKCFGNHSMKNHGKH